MQQYTYTDTMAQQAFALAVTGTSIVAGDQHAESGGILTSGKINILELDQNSGTLILSNEIFPHDPQPNSMFGGTHLAASGDLLLVGAPRYDEGTALNQGKVYVYQKSGNAWVLDDELISPYAQQDDYFGSSVAIDGDLAVISADAAQIGFVFQRDNQLGTWAKVAELNEPIPQAYQQTSKCVSIRGQDIIVADNYSVYMYQYDSLSGDCPLTYSFQTVSYIDELAFDGDDSILLSHITFEGNDNIGKVVAYVLDTGSDTWVEQQMIPNPAPQPYDNFGHTLSLQGNHLLVGSSYGGVWHYVWDANAAVWAQRGAALAGSAGYIGQRGIVTSGRNTNDTEVNVFTP